MRQSGSAFDPTVPKEEDRMMFSDIPALSLEQDRIDAMHRLNELSRKNGYEYATIFADGKIVDEAITSHARDHVAFDLSKYPGKKLEIYHSHTNDTTFSQKDFQFLCNPRVARIGVISYNGDTYSADAEFGARPTVKEYASFAEQLRRDCDRMYFSYTYEHLTPGERSYLSIKEQAYKTARYYEWRYEEGRADDDEL